MNEKSVRIESSDSELREVISRWLTDAGYSVVKNGGALTIVDAETMEASDRRVEQKCLYLVYSKSRHVHELLRPFTKSEFMTAVGGCVRANENILDELTIDRNRQSILFRGGEAMLTDKEFAVFEYLYEHGAEGVTYEELSEIAMSRKEKETNAAQVYVCFLRAKLEKLTGNPLIKTIRGRGYALGKL